MANKTLIRRLEEVKYQASVRPRELICPSVEVKTATSADREKIAQVARRVIAEHREVLVALKDR